MTIFNKSVFYYGIKIESGNFNLDFSEGAGELTAFLRLGFYTLTSLAIEVARALSEAGGQDYEVTVNRSDRTYTISADSNFSILTGSGSHQGIMAWDITGFEGPDKTGTNSYLGSLSVGKEFLPTAPLQSFTPPEHYKDISDAVINDNGSEVEVFTVGGEKRFAEFSIGLITNNEVNNSLMTNNQNAVSEILDFLDYITDRGPYELMRDVDDRDTFEQFLLESTISNRKGVGFKLIEMLSKKMVGYYETGILKSRKL